MFPIGRLTFLAGTVLFAATIQAAAADALKIGISASLTGPSAEAGRYTVNGAQLAADEINRVGGILGQQIKLVIEDDQTTNPGSVLAFSRLAGDPEIRAFLGPQRSTAIQAIVPDAMKASRPMMIGGTDPKLTHMGVPWLFRCRPNDSYSAKVIAAFGVNTLIKRKWAIIHSTDTFGTSGKNALVDELKALGVEPVIVQNYTNNSQDFTPVVLAVKKSAADIVSSYVTLDTDHGILARQMRQLGVDAAWVGSPTMVSTTALNLAGPALHGTYGVADFNEKSSPTAEAFAQKYKATYGLQADFFSAWSYDAIHILAKAVAAAGGTDPNAIRSAILDVRRYEGAEGTYDFDQNGDGLHGYNIVHYDNGTWVFDRHIDFKD
jgi:branched-chain amino acid transport system substrate-binding protein